METSLNLICELTNRHCDSSTIGLNELVKTCRWVWFSFSYFRDEKHFFEAILHPVWLAWPYKICATSLLEDPGNLFSNTMEEAEGSRNVTTLKGNPDLQATNNSDSRVLF